MKRFFEDVNVGEKFTSRTHHLSKSEIIEYAKEFDPQAMHIDETEATNTFFGTLVASGWHMTSLTMRLMVDTAPLGSTPQIGANVKDLRFVKKVLPDTVIQCHGEVVSKKNLENKKFGFVDMRVETRDQVNGDLLLSQTWSLVVPNKP